MGGVDSEPLNAMTVYYSPQLRKVVKLTEPIYQVFIVPKSYIFRLTNMIVEHFSEQGKQDLIIRLVIASSSKQYGQTGKTDVATPGIYVTENRLFSEAGAPYTEISSAAGSGKPDNFYPPNGQYFAIAYEDEVVSFKITNQSAVYDHWVRLYLTGWTFPLNGKTKEEVLLSLANKQ